MVGGVEEARYASWMLVRGRGMPVLKAGRGTVLKAGTVPLAVSALSLRRCSNTPRSASSCRARRIDDFSLSTRRAAAAAEAARWSICSTASCWPISRSSLV
eukprot:1287056-Prymnesium_polylepis.1